MKFEKRKKIWKYIENHNEKLELLNSFQKFKFVFEVSPRGPRPTGSPPSYVTGCELRLLKKHALWPDTTAYFLQSISKIQLVVGTYKRLLSFSHDNQIPYKLTTIWTKTLHLSYCDYTVSTSGSSMWNSRNFPACWVHYYGASKSVRNKCTRTYLSRIVLY